MSEGDERDDTLGNEGRWTRRDSDFGTAEPVAPRDDNRQPADLDEPDAGASSGSRPWWGEAWSRPDDEDTDAAARPPQDTVPLPEYQQRKPAGGGLGRGRGVLLTALVIVGIVLFTGIGAAIGVQVGKDDKNTGGGGNVTVNKAGNVATAPVVNSDGSTNIESVASSVLPSVVSIQEKTQTLEGTGSGVIIDANHGYILTNNHVVSAAASGTGDIMVSTNDNRMSTATVVGRDPSSDIAVVQVKLDNLTAANIGDSSSLKVGQTVVAFGSPLGLQGSVTSGIVSALDRPVSTSDSNDNSAASTQATIDAVQTDAAINPGNSGGPLVDGAGRVIGINSAIASTGSSSGGGQSGNIGVGFSIPINEAMDTAQQIITTGHAVHPVIDASIRTPQGTQPGAEITSVVSGGPAADAGLQKGDVITKIDGKAVADPDAAVVALRKDRKPGDRVQIVYVRGGATRTTTVTLAASPPSP